MKQHTLEKTRETPDSFEETYPRYPFAELVRLGIGGARWVLRLRRKLGTETGRARRQGPYPDASAASREHGRLVLKRVHHWYHLRHRPTGQTE